MYPSHRAEDANIRYVRYVPGAGVAFRKRQVVKNNREITALTSTFLARCCCPAAMMLTLCLASSSESHVIRVPIALLSRISIHVTVFFSLCSSTVGAKPVSAKNSGQGKTNVTRPKSRNVARDVSSTAHHQIAARPLSRCLLLAITEEEISGALLPKSTASTWITVRSAPLATSHNDPHTPPLVLHAWQDIFSKECPLYSIHSHLRIDEQKITFSATDI